MFHSQPVQQGFDFAVAVLDLTLDDVEQFEVLSQSEQVLGSIVAGERSRDLFLGSSTAVVALGCQGRGIRDSGDDISQDTHPRHAGNIADHIVE